MEEKFGKKINRFLKDAFTTDDTFWENEICANLQMAYIMLMGIVVLIAAWALNEFGVFHIDNISIVAIQGIIESLIPAVICIVLKGKKHWLKYLMMVEYVIVLARVDCALSFNAVLLMALPVVLSCRYYSMHFTAQVAALTSVLFGLSAYAGSAWKFGILDLNFYDPPAGTTLIIESTMRNAFETIGVDLSVRTSEYMLLYFVPKLMIFSVIAIGCTLIAKHGHNLVVKQANIVGENARIESELTLATDIQANMLPRIFPPFPDHTEFDIYATMNPAREVGGDFYDFFMIDDSHIAFVIADVSGKGVPAALFMVTAKTLIKDHAQLGLPPAEVFTRVNSILCEGNDAGLFVTAWMGVLDIQSGNLTYVNAGHNPPLLCSDGKYSFLRSKPGFVLAGMDSIHYRQAALQMMPNDKIYLYTDGVTEATNTSCELYGDERLLSFLNAHSDSSGKTLLTAIRNDINSFAGDAEQFDDITMLHLEYKGTVDNGVLEKTFPAKDEYMSELLDFVAAELKKAEAPQKTLMQISVAVEEIFVNVAHYAYPERTGNVKLELLLKANYVQLCFKDRGIPFNPLTRENPDITLSAEERDIGGLGILIVKKTMDSVVYQYKDGMNILTIEKNW